MGDIAIVVIIPIIVPALVLAYARANAGVGAYSWNISDFAFGIVAAAFASIARVLSIRSGAKLLFVAVALVIVAFETAVAVFADTFATYEDVREELNGGLGDITGAKADQLHALLLSLSDKQPSSLQWIVCFALGFALAAFASLLIWTQS